jgi:hypothetical protein
MKVSVMLLASLLLAACATQPPPPGVAQPSAGGATPEPLDHSEDAVSLVAADVTRIAITPLAEETVCRRERPTGSRIAVERCYVVVSTAEGSAMHDAARQIMREEFELLRRQQLAQEQARQRAMQDRAMSDPARAQQSQ